jgi:hypothetical protein
MVRLRLHDGPVGAPHEDAIVRRGAAEGTAERVDRERAERAGNTSRIRGITFYVWKKKYANLGVSELRIVIERIQTRAGPRRMKFGAMAGHGAAAG